MLQIQTGEQSVAESVALLKALSRGGAVWRIELASARFAAISC